jgi:UDP-N-acetylglucosamine/UDP-N-acetylgalactosamine diphosphorylase
MANMDKVSHLISKGVRIPSPSSVEIDDRLNLDGVAGQGVVLHAGSRIFGRNTFIGEGSILGGEGPVTVENCRIGPGVELKGGFFRNAVFLEKASCGLGAHVREGTILEEEASIAHAVGLKQTILFPYVTLGSLINFCDCLMAGGTGRENHSEVGSSYVHFNFTPNQDKATASLFGDVPRGVMLNREPIFLGGQGGAVGPVRLNFGITVAAGTILRKDERRSGRLIFGGAGKGGNIAFRPGGLSNVRRIVENNFFYIANLLALRQWYREVRALFVGTRFPEALLEGLRENVELAVAERVRRLKGFGERLPGAGGLELQRRWPAVEEAISAQKENAGDASLRETLQQNLARLIGERGKDYLAVIPALPPEAAEAGTRWLDGIVAKASSEAIAACGELGSRE